jgi:hypothetical protein
LKFAIGAPPLLLIADGKLREINKDEKTREDGAAKSVFLAKINGITFAAL